MKKIVLHGFYGQGNLGDEAILKALLEQFSERHNLKLVVFCRNPEKVSDQYGVKSVHSQSGRHWLERIWELKTAGLYILGGGGLIKDYGGSSASLEGWLEILRLCKKLHVKTALCAVGVENIRYPRSKTVLKQVLDKVDFITVRDEDSKNLLKEIGIENNIDVISDPAILLTEGKTRKLAEKKNDRLVRVIVCVRHWFDQGFFIADPAKNENLANALSRTLDFLVDNYNVRIDFIPMRTVSYDDDREMAKEIVKYMKNKNKAALHLYSTSTSVDEFTREVDRCTLVIGMRLHSLILAAASGVPIIGLEYMPKVKAFMASIGMQEFSHNLENLTASTLIHSIKKILGNYENYSSQLVLKIAEKKQILSQSIEQLVKRND